MFECGCEPRDEGGYGEDGSHSRYFLDWCSLHAKAPELRDMLERMATFFMNGCQCRMSTPKFTCIVHEARALLAEIELPRDVQADAGRKRKRKENAVPNRRPPKEQLCSCPHPHARHACHNDPASQEEDILRFDEGGEA